MRPNYFFDMDGTLAVYDPLMFSVTTPWYLNLRSTNYFAECPPHTRIVDVVNDLIKDGQNVYILTSIAGISLEDIDDFNAIASDKWKWIEKHIPCLPEECFVISGYPRWGYSTKAEAGAGKLGRPLALTDVLIDDFNTNLDSWKEAGGTAVKILNGINSEREDLFCVSTSGSRAELKRQLLRCHEWQTDSIL